MNPRSYLCRHWVFCSRISSLISKVCFWLKGIIFIPKLKLFSDLQRTLFYLNYIWEGNNCTNQNFQMKKSPLHISVLYVINKLIFATVVGAGDLQTDWCCPEREGCAKNSRKEEHAVWWVVWNGVAVLVLSYQLQRNMGMQLTTMTFTDNIQRNTVVRGLRRWNNFINTLSCFALKVRLVTDCSLSSTSVWKGVVL